MKEKKNYTIGLDIGTNSVGWSVMYDDLSLASRKMRVKGLLDKNGKNKRVHKNFWGVRLFDEGKTAENRRLKRTARRRLARRRNRIMYLRDIFATEMMKVDGSFFHRLDESFLIEDDKTVGIKYPIFPNLEEEKQYHKDFPTIYHLRNKLYCESEKADLRLVYLALHHIMKFRGHFLIDGKLNAENSEVSGTLIKFIDAYNDAFSLQEDGSLINPISFNESAVRVLENNMSRSTKAREALATLEATKNEILKQFLILVVGNKANFKKIFSLEEDAKLQLTDESYDELESKLLSEIGDGYLEVFAAAKSLYNAVELSGVLNGHKAISESMIERYSNHEEDLAIFKSYVKENLYDKYTEVFKDKTKKGYAGYIHGGVSQDDFYKYVEGLLGKNPENRIALDILEKIGKESFLRKQRTFDNGSIPHQIHWLEAERIIENQGSHYPFLNDNFDKIKDIFTFRIPYYIGPLAKTGESDFAWNTRKSDEQVRPWNIKEVIDFEQSAVDFIERMTNNCMYLPKEKVLPKRSMLYEEFTVYNELTKIKYQPDTFEKAQFFTVEQKRKIVDTYFKDKKSVSEKDIISYLQSEGYENVKLTGIEKKFNAKLNTYNDLRLLGISNEVLDAPENAQIFEEIVKILTIFEDRKMLKSQLKKFESKFGEELVTKLSKKHYTGWGRLSEKLLDGLRDKNSNKTIIDFLKDDSDINRNFMQLINDNELSFKSKIEEDQTEIEELSNEEIVQGLAGSPAIKKGILQSLKIVEELVEIMGYAPTNIVVEMARENQTTTQGKNNSRPRLKRLETALAELKSSGEKVVGVKENNEKLRSDRLYLYYLQNGKDMYTGEPLEIDKLSLYDIDHIIPQSFLTDNSIDNLVLTSSEANRSKLDDVPSKAIVSKMSGFWSRLKAAGLISERKFLNLTKASRGGLTEDDKAGFIKRQLVETRQITKHVARILHEKYNRNITEDESKNVRVVTLKSALTGQFRREFDLYKVREINDYHHAHDAYLNCVVANTLLKIYPQLESEFVYGEFKHAASWGTYKKTATDKKNFYLNIMKNFSKDIVLDKEGNGEIIWKKEEDIATVKRVLSYRQMNFTKKLEDRASNENGKQLYKETVEGRKGAGKNLIKSSFKRADGSKKSLDLAIYGGYIEEKEAFITIDENDKLKSVKRTEVDKYKDSRKILRNQIFENDGCYRSVASIGESGKWNQFVLDERYIKYIYWLNRYDNAETTEDKITFVNDHRHYFEEIKELLFDFIKKNNLIELNKIAIPSEHLSIKSETELIGALLNIASRGTTSENKYSEHMYTDKKGKEVNLPINPRTRYTSATDKLNKQNSTLIHYSVTGLHETRKGL